MCRPARSAGVLGVERSFAALRMTLVGAAMAEKKASLQDDLKRLEEIGRALEVADDVLDVTGTSADLGKTAGKDQATAKSTYVRLLGVDGARAEANRHAAEAVGHLDRTGVPSGALG